MDDATPNSERKNILQEINELIAYQLAASCDSDDDDVQQKELNSLLLGIIEIIGLHVADLETHAALITQLVASQHARIAVLENRLAMDDGK